MTKYLWIACLGALSGSGFASGIDDFDKYRFKLEINAEPKVCNHMERVYNQKFASPWDFRATPKDESIPRMSYVEEDDGLASRLGYSLLPRSAEFNAIGWREGRAYFADASNSASPTLVAKFDINNDGKEDEVIKFNFMLSIEPGGGRAAGGRDYIFVLRPGALDLEKPIELGRLFKQLGDEGPRLLSYMTLHYTDVDRPKELSKNHQTMGVRLIRPFLFEGKSYLSVYVQWAVNDPKLRREWMWVLAYKGGGRNRGKGDWEPAIVDKLCRFQMIAVKND